MHAAALQLVGSWLMTAVHACMQDACAPALPSGGQPVVFVADICEACPPSQLSIHAAYMQSAIGSAGNGSLPMQFRQVGNSTRRALPASL
jgi:hypothetical protein